MVGLLFEICIVDASIFIISLEPVMAALVPAFGGGWGWVVWCLGWGGECVMNLSAVVLLSLRAQSLRVCRLIP